jgi:ATP-dependent RNA helicase DeaD
VEDEDRALGAKLLETMSPQDIAAALVQVHRAKMPVAAEMLDDGNRERAKESHRDGFDESVWFKLNIGRNNNADPKWILPLLCRRGGVTKNDIGAIRITANETHVGIAQAAAARFAKAIQTPGRDEDHDVEITQGEGPPRDAARANKRTSRDGGAREERGREERGREDRGRSGPRREGQGREGTSSERATLAPRYGMPRSDGPPSGGKPKGKPGGKPFGTRSNGPRGDSVRPFGGGAPSKHGVKHKAKGNRPR